VRGEGYHLCILQPSFGSPSSSPSNRLVELEWLISIWDPESVILYVCKPNPKISSLVDLRRMGFSFFLLQGVDDDERSVLRMVARTETRRRLRKMLEELEHGLEADTLELLCKATTAWPEARSAAELAGRLQMSQRTLQRTLRQKRLPTAGKIVSCSRFLELSTLWKEMWIRDRYRIASLLGYADPSSLNHLSRALTGQPLNRFLHSLCDADPYRWFAQMVLRRASAEP